MPFQLGASPAASIVCTLGENRSSMRYVAYAYFAFWAFIAVLTYAPNAFGAATSIVGSVVNRITECTLPRSKR